MLWFYDPVTKFSKEQIQSVRPLDTESLYDYVLRWTNIKMMYSSRREDRNMVWECRISMGRRLSVPEENPTGLLKEVFAQQAQPMEAACNIITIREQPLFAEQAQLEESLAVLRFGKTTLENRGKSPANQPELGAATTSQPAAEAPTGVVEYDIISHLHRLPARLSIYDALQQSQEAREALINALTDESVWNMYLAEALECDQTITFTDENLLLGNTEHNRPLFVSGDLAGERINRIMLDLGSAVNILPLKTLKRIGLCPTVLKSTNLVIQGFNQGSQRTMGTVSLDLDIQGFLTKVNYHVINAPTSYNLLLGRPWMHQYKVVASTVHQCFDVLSGRVMRRISADDKPFTTSEAFYSDAKYYALVPPEPVELKPEEPKIEKPVVNRRQHPFIAKRVEPVQSIHQRCPLASP